MESRETQEETIASLERIYRMGSRIDAYFELIDILTSKIHECTDAFDETSRELQRITDDAKARQGA